MPLHRSSPTTTTPMLNRRQFLGRVAATATAAAFTGALQGAPATSAPANGIGFSLYGMKSMALTEALRACADIGYTNIEIALNPGYPTEPKLFDTAARKDLAKRLADRKMTVSGLMENLSLLTDDKTLPLHLDRIKAAAQFAHDLVPSDPPVIETVLGGKPAEWDQVKDRMAERLSIWAKTATEAKVVLAIKAHVMSAVQNPDRLLWLMDQVKSPSIKAAYDFSHFELQGLSMESTMKALLPHTRFIHVKDTAGTPEKVQFLLPGEGTTDYAQYFTLLKKFNYTGPVVVEVSGMVFNKAGYDPVGAALKSFVALSTAKKKAASGA